ncbi:MAG: type III-A CRISPR-associated protein Cas10/Csm1 [Deltaproteobacteria bacterium]|jgi:CRISPR-associated protein Csm1|nr:type III-A CRISPR-associated protein Cas10/Csm1 [Deltaproteobacteria bacterium]
MNLLDSSSRVAFAAMIHDLGKFAQRADDPAASRFAALLDGNIHTYCRRQNNGGYFSHRHAAYTALAFDELADKWPDVLHGDVPPFASRTRGEEKTDSLINAAAAHHRPDTLLQWIVATADRVASGFEREEFEKYNAAEDKTDTGRNHYQARLLSILENICIKEHPGERKEPRYAYRYPLLPMSAEGIFPHKREECEPDNDAAARKEYKKLWDAFVEGLEQIPASHRKSWPLWLDHFDSLWLAFTQAIPSATAFGVKPDVSLYDHSKATAALAVALWRFARAAGSTGPEAIGALGSRADWDEKKFLLIQGDFFGIQNFIFAEGSKTNRQAAKILRGRSFQVALFTELAALKVLELLELPPTSQILNAAGKFLIVAPHTKDALDILREARQEFDAWFLRHGFALTGMGLAWEPASCNDFCGGKGEKDNFSILMRTLFANQEKAKYRRYNLCGDNGPGPVLEADFSKGVCDWHGRLPADRELDGEKSCSLSRDQILIGQNIVRRSRLLIVREEDAGKISGEMCELPVFGYKIMFAEEESARGQFGELAASGVLRRCWDFSLPKNMTGTLWNGYARRQINGYVPRYAEAAERAAKKYGAKGMEEITPGGVKTLDHIACEDQLYDSEVRVCGQAALTVLKGDVDDLGRIFQKGARTYQGQRPTFARMAALSRQINAFFAVRLPALCARDFPDVYTVFAGGDDFFLIGPWLSTQKLAGALAEEFQRYAAANPQIHFSAGMVMKKPGSSVYALAEEAEQALHHAKELDEKNAFCLFDAVVPWQQWGELTRAEKELERVRNAYGLSTGFMYSLLSMLDMRLSEGEKLEGSLWRSRLYYSAARTLERARTPSSREAALRDIVTILGKDGIDKLGKAFRIPLFNFMYQKRG